MFHLEAGHSTIACVELCVYMVVCVVTQKRLNACCYLITEVITAVLLHNLTIEKLSLLFIGLSPPSISVVHVFSMLTIPSSLPLSQLCAVSINKGLYSKLRHSQRTD